MKRKISFLLMAVFVTMMVLGFTGVEIAQANELRDALDGVRSSGGGAIDASATKKIEELGADGISLVGTIVMTIVVMSGLWTAIKFAGVGDNPQKKSILKVALVFHILGIVFLANYFGLIDFAFDNLTIF